MANSYDLVVIGAGNAGQAAAGVARAADWSVAIIESREVGGTCPLRGCVPKKILVAATETADLVSRAAAQNVNVGEATIDWPALVGRKRDMIAPMPDGMEASLKKRGIEVIHGRARFSGPSTVEVNGSTLQARNIVVATGSKPRPLPFAGAEHLVTSADVLELSSVPKRVAFVGGGVIALELGHVLARAGASVSIFEIGSRPLLNFDEDAIRALLEYSTTLGIEIHANVRVERASKRGDSVELSVKSDGAVNQHEFDVVVNGAGRIADLDDLDLPAAGIALDGTRVKLDSHLRSTSNSSVWFAGDAITGAPQLSPVATYEGRVVGHNLLNDDDLQTPDYSTLPSALFTVPTVATIGLTEEQAAAQGIEVTVKTNDMSGWLSAKTYAEKVAFAKTLVAKNDDRIVGAHLVGHGAAETIHIFAMAMRMGMTATELKKQLYVYPSFANDIKFLV